ncbi:MAG TPA: TIGR03546 family protein [Spirochaetota bacterium]|nr:TIGR03546 family protein [Spirochaetota bacterium]HOL56415.1 TIGR03546 family protein [Spirochaetota bacterium]HPP03406.1 TIGR03546 family protein [Spirochaetota bacterium]
MPIIKIISNFFKLLTEDAKPYQVGLGFAFGFLLGFQPATLLSFILFLIFWIIKVNKAAGILGLIIFKIIALIIEPLIVPIGSLFLEGIPALTPLWTKLRSLPIVPFTRFYNTAVMGGFIIGIVGFVPVFLGFRILYIYYKENLREKFLNSKFIKIVKSIPIINLFFSVKNTVENATEKIGG